MRGNTPAPSIGTMAISHLSVVRRPPRRLAASLGMALAIAASVTFGACSKTSAAADSASAGGTAEASPATAPGTADSATLRPVTVPAEQLGRLHVEPVATTSFRPTIQVTGTAQFDADVSTQVLAPISGPVTRILADVGAEVRRGQALALVSSPDFATTVADFRKAQAAYVQTKRVADQNEQLWKNDAIARRDLPAIQGTVLFLSFVFVFVNLLADVAYAKADPRISYK